MRHRPGTLDSAIRRALLVAAERTAVVDGDTSLTYDELDRRVAGLRGGLLGRGLGPGARVAGLALNSRRHLEAWLAIPTAGLVFADLNVRLAPAELAFVLDDAGAELLLADRAHWEVAVDLLDRVDSLRELIWLDDGPGPAGVAAWDDLAAAAPAPVPAHVDADTVASISYTGGTTGRPKGVMQTHGNLTANAKHMLWANPVGPHDRYLHITPMFHAAGVANLYSLTLVGGTHVICPRFDAPLVAELIERHRITVCVLVPTMIAMFLADPTVAGRDLSSWRMCFYAASPMPVAVLRQAMTALPCRFTQGYGMTEMCPHVTQLTADDHDRAAAGEPEAVRRLASAGTPCVGVDVEVRRIDGSVAPVGEVGEITVRGPNMTPGYWQRAEETAAAFTDDGWYRTGDLGRLDDGGYLFVVDRAKDMIITGGENVYTTEVENALATHPAVAEVAVFGIPDDQWGEAVHAEVALRSDATASDGDLIAHCRATIGGFKVPRSITVHAEPLPKSGAGKILKRELRAPYWAGNPTS